MSTASLNRSSLSSAIVFLAAVLLGSPVGAAQDTALIDLPSSGRLRDVEQHLVSSLQSRGVEVVEAPVRQLPDPAPTSLVTDDNSLRDAQWRETLAQFIRAGGGMVLIVGRGQRHVEQANTFLTALGMEIVAERATLAALEFYPSALTVGLSPPEAGSLRMRIAGERIVPIARQGGSIVCAGVPVDEGGVIVIPDQLVVADIKQPPEQRSGLALLARAVSWSSRLAQLAAVSVAPGMSIPPGHVALPLERRDFAGAILYDCQASEDHWPQIAAVVVGALEQSELPIKALRIRDVEDPLVEALRSRPELVVLGSWRWFSVTELAEIYQYVASGGSLLALAHAHTDRQIRLVCLNQALTQFGAVCALSRAGGPAQATGGPLPELGNIPWGTRVVGRAVEPLITVADGRQLAAGYLEFQNGRVMIMDAGPLVSNGAYRLQLEERAIPWLLRR